MFFFYFFFFIFSSSFLSWEFLHNFNCKTCRTSERHRYFILLFHHFLFLHLNSSSFIKQRKPMEIKVKLTKKKQIKSN